MAKERRISTAAKIAMIGIPLIIAQGIYLLLFSTDDTVTAQMAIEKAVNGIKNVMIVEGP